MSKLPVLGYWNIRGLGQSIRLMLGYLEVDFQEKHYVIGDGPEYSYEDWYKEKFNLGLDFPNLPYYIEGDLKLTQSNAILRYLARKHGLMGKTEEEQYKCDLLAEQTCDLRKRFVELCYGDNYQSAGPVFVADLPKQLEMLQKFLGENQWFAGPNMTWADFLTWEVLDQLMLFHSSSFDGLSKLLAYHQRFMDVPTIKKFMESPKFFKGACRGKMANWGGSYPEPPAPF